MMTPTLDLHAPHFHAGRFFCPWLDPKEADRGLGDVLRWQLGPKPWRREKRTVPTIARVENDGSSLLRRGDDATITWVGQSTFVIEDGETPLVTDPHFGPRALVPRRLSEPGLPVEAIPADALGVLSHNHYDHLDAWSVRALPSSMQWFAPLGHKKWFRSLGREVTELDWWQSVKHRGWKLTCLPAQHWSNRVRTPRNGALWCSWLLDNGKHRYFFTGDSGYFHGFETFRRELAPVDVALLPVAAYEPRWFMRPQHMNPEEALLAFDDLGARHMLAMHWGTFDLTDEPIDLGRARLEELVVGRGEEFGDRVHAPALGQRWKVPRAESAPADPQ